MYKIEKEELVKLNNMLYDENLKPNFELIKYCLIWNDEVVEGISGEARELLYDLLIYRGFLHENIPIEKWTIDQEYMQSSWDFGLKYIPDWPGFKRLTLSNKEKEYLEESINASEK